MEEDSAPKQQSHLSADDLNDGFILDKEDRKTLAYQVNQKRGFSIVTFLTVFACSWKTVAW